MRLTREAASHPSAGFVDDYITPNIWGNLLKAVAPPTGGLECPLSTQSGRSLKTPTLGFIQQDGISSELSAENPPSLLLRDARERYKPSPETSRGLD